MGRLRGIVRKIADETGLDQATARRALAASNMSEQDCEADFAKAVETVSALADTDRVMGHAANGRGEGGHISELAAAKGEAEKYRAEKLRLQNAKLAGHLVDRDAVTETGVRMLAKIRTTFLALGHRVADKAVGKDAREIARIVEAEVRGVLAGLADEEKFLAALEDEALE
jgi:hypothetical protein